MDAMILEGESEREYEFEMYHIDGELSSIELSSGPGCYAFTKSLTKNNEYPIVYIGHTKDLGERFDSHHKAECIEREGATLIGIRRTRNKRAAQRIEADVLGPYAPSCNG